MKSKNNTKYGPRSTVHRINLAPLITKSVEKSDIIPYKSLESEFDSVNDVVHPPINNTGLKVLCNSSVYHRGCLEAVAADVTRSGWQPLSMVSSPSEEEKERLEMVFNDYPNNEALYNVILDYRTYTHAAFEIVKDINGDLQGFKHVRALTIAMRRGGDSAVQRIGAKTRYFKIFGHRQKEHENLELDDTTGNWVDDVPFESQATEIVWLNARGPDSDYYHEPDYLPAINTILSDEYLREYNKSGLQANGVPNYLITITGDFEAGERDPDTLMTAFEEDLEKSFNELPNKPGTALVLTLSTTDSTGRIDTNVTRLSEEMKEASFEKFRESNMKEILAAHKVPPGRLGISMDGALGGAVDVERNKNYNNRVVKPLQLMLDTVLNQIITEIMLIDDWKHQYKSLDIRDINAEFEMGLKAVQNSIMKPIELREHITELFDLDNNPDDLNIILAFPELDKFYMLSKSANAGGDEANLPSEELQSIMKNLDSKWTEIMTK
jgi:capsid portal protein